MSKERELLGKTLDILCNITTFGKDAGIKTNLVDEIDSFLSEQEWKPIETATKKYMHELIGLEWDYELNDWQKIFIVWGHVAENEMGWIDNCNPYRKCNPEFYYELPEPPEGR